MNSLELSGHFAQGVILLALWAVIAANRAAPSARPPPDSHTGRSIQGFAKTWNRKLQRAFA